MVAKKPVRVRPQGMTKKAWRRLRRRLGIPPSTPLQAAQLNSAINRVEKAARKEEKAHGHSGLWLALIGLAGAGFAGYLWWKSRTTGIPKLPSPSPDLKSEDEVLVSDEDLSSIKRVEEDEREGFNTSSPDTVV